MAGCNELYDPLRAQGRIIAERCWARARRQFFGGAGHCGQCPARRRPRGVRQSRCRQSSADALFDIEHGTKAHGGEKRLRVRREQSAPVLVAVEAWLREQRSRLSNSSLVAGPIDCLLQRWFVRFIDGRRVCMTNKAAERALRSFAPGRRSWLFRRRRPLAVMATLIMKLNDVDPETWLADVLARIADTPTRSTYGITVLGTEEGAHAVRCLTRRTRSPAALTGV
jgi:hypothetical protein